MSAGSAASGCQRDIPDKNQPAAHMRLQRRELEGGSVGW